MACENSTHSRIEAIGTQLPMNMYCGHVVCGFHPNRPSYTVHRANQLLTGVAIGPAPATRSRAAAMTTISMAIVGFQ